MRYHLSPFKCTNIKKIDNTHICQGYRERETFTHNWWTYILMHFNGVIYQYQFNFLNAFLLFLELF